ncbi:hypothetical protein BDP27DRAFT_804087 [Rhodocollybia butyracea]|uniref:Uncharacterized protein n=1 Tax=Rhodocollybia butyracea TaxID=206335 RepID=A0A9P5UDU7_9AGAR|nr:hypothetical protein BDP27DRAFT_804087 [Rhodocollybia butyracea]
MPACGVTTHRSNESRSLLMCLISACLYDIFALHTPLNLGLGLATAEPGTITLTQFWLSINKEITSGTHNDHNKTDG